MKLLLLKQYNGFHLKIRLTKTMKIIKTIFLHLILIIIKYYFFKSTT